MKKVLVVDDSALMRRVLSDIINKDEEFHTEHSARDGLEALKLMEQNDFDAIVLDIIMPRMNGIDFLKEVNERGYTAKIIIVSTIARKGAGETIEALELGAFDFVTKPGNLREAKSGEFAAKVLSRLYLAMGMEWNNILSGEIEAPEQILRRMRRSDAGVIQEHSERLETTEYKPEKSFPRSSMVNVNASGKLVALACSTGGPKALQQVIPKLPENLDAAVVLVQHMPVGFTASLSARLDEMSEIRVREAQDGEVLQKGTVYIAKGGSQMRVIEKNRHEFVLSVREEGARNGLKPCADILYESLRESSFEDITCVIMTGMGADGTKGILQLKETNKIYVIAQNAESSTVYGMPKAIAESGAVDEIKDLDLIADAIIKHVGVR
ncbi:chemotaxis response regulator protein-glutamate methylesterase [Clostridium sp. CAG:277]|nr:chemotaxis response regulator protein-glutamate methylesterase [Clostridium sp. CAG:277]